VSHSLTLSSSWDLDLWKKLSHQSQSSRIILEIQKQEYEQMREAIIYLCFQKYLDYHCNKVKLNLIREQITLEQKIHEIQKIEFKNGQRPFSSFQTQKNKIIQLNQNLHRAISKAKNIEIEIKQLIGNNDPEKITENLNEKFQLTSHSESLKLPMLGLPSNLLENRPDMMIASLNIEEKDTQIKIQSRALYPDISLGGSITSNTKHLKDLLDPEKMLSQIIAQLAQPIFNRGSLKSKEAIARVRYRQSVNQFSNALSKAIKEVEMGIVNFNNLQTLINKQNQKISNVEMNLNLSEKNYDAGINKLEIILRSKLELSKLEVENIDIIQTQILTYTQLLKSIGARWQLAPSKISNKNNSNQGN
jgi:outer membrane protein TolC